MNRFTVSAMAIMVLGASALPALAQAPRLQSAESRQAVMICATDVATRRAYQREHGVAPTFVTAREAVEARRNGETWVRPRCMTEREYNRLIDTARTRAAI